MKHIFHVCALPHTNTNSDFMTCAYTQKVIKFCKMMMGIGHTVYLYGMDADKNEAPCTEFISCGTNSFTKENYLDANFDVSAFHWLSMNKRVIGEIEKHRMPHDYICLIAGICQKQIADAFPDMISVEFGIGYGGVFAKYKVFESYAWMHTVYGATQGSHSANGEYFDAVIPNYFDPNDFPLSEIKDDYFLFVGRLIDRKGFQIASDVCKHLGKRLIVAGQGTPPEYGEYVGVVNAKQRGELMSKAKAVFVPTQYLEPFGGVAAEALLCGTPVITTDWGAFSEYVHNGIQGYRCRSFEEFIQAAKMCDQGADMDALQWDYKGIQSYARSKWSMDVIALQYQKYFDRLAKLWGKGWYELAEEKNLSVSE